MKLKNTQFGYSLVEVLVAIAVLMLAIIGPMSIASRGIKSSTFSLEQNSAFFLAQEGIEAIFALRGDYALQDIKSGISPSDPNESWDWVNTLLNNGVCSGNKIQSSGSGVCSFGVDFRNNNVKITPVTCDAGNEANCLLYYNEGNARAVYTHNTNDSPSPFTRIITVKYLSDSSVEVTSTVTWHSSVFAGVPVQKVTLVTNLFDTI